ncbi:hypothetical protein AB0F13_26880 [Streptomyces sp. NPDC026206]|uniref:hypothetical protein n=1 Tax=Streptomyces sp. NPDC026206 TaxID=3157089 RepID=UPI0033E22625
MTTPTTTTSDTVTSPQPDPLIGKVVRDTVRDRLGRVMDHLGSRYQLRPLDGGREWDTEADNIEVVDVPRCDACDRLKAERGKAHREGRTAAARGFTAALSRHLRVMHP